MIPFRESAAMLHAAALIGGFFIGQGETSRGQNRKEDEGMSVDLYNDSGDYFCASNRGWFKFLSLARMGGWEPMGTLPPEGWPEDTPWDGGYSTNDGQRVTAADAAAMASAMARCLGDIPDEDVPDRNTRVKELMAQFDNDLPEHLRATYESDGMAQALVGVMVSWMAHPPLEYFSGPKMKGWVREFIAFAEKGGFVIR
jgi:hypothetical protein